MGQYQIISADSHVSPPPTFWRDYLPGSFTDRAPSLESTDEGDFVVFEGRKTPFIMLSNLAGEEGRGLQVKGKISDTRPGGWDPTERVKDQDIDGWTPRRSTEAARCGRKTTTSPSPATAPTTTGWRTSASPRPTGSSASPTFRCGMWMKRSPRSSTPPRSAFGGALIPGVSPDGADYTDPSSTLVGRDRRSRHVGAGPLTVGRAEHPLRHHAALSCRT